MVILKRILSKELLSQWICSAVKKLGDWDRGEAAVFEELIINRLNVDLAMVDMIGREHLCLLIS